MKCYFFSNPANDSGRTVTARDRGCTTYGKRDPIWVKWTRYLSSYKSNQTKDCLSPVKLETNKRKVLQTVTVDKYATED